MEPDIALNGSLKNKHILLHLSDGTAELLFAQFPDVHAININMSLLDIVVSADEI